MENFVVSARKYRPSTFDTVVGQSHITTTLRNAIKSDHLAQAFLFCGPRGVGKTTCARILAKTINCQNLTPEIEACDQCESCTSFSNNASFNIHELDAASNNSVDDIRNLVDQVRYPPQSGKYKIYIIDEVHMLSNSAFNAFLKTLEEPPSYAIFILATTEKHKIIPTILSRCQIFDFNRIQQQDISRHLQKIAAKEQIEAEEEALQLIAQKADGGLRDALSMFDLIVTFSSDNRITYKTTIENLHILDYDYYFQMTDSLLRTDMSQALLIFDEILRNGFDGHNFMVGLCEHFRNLMVCKDAETVRLLEVSVAVQQKYLSQAAQASMSFLLSALNIGNQCDLNYKSSKNQRLHVELTLMKMAHVGSVINLHPNEGALKKKLNTVAAPVAEAVSAPAPVAPRPEPVAVAEPITAPVREKEAEPSRKEPLPSISYKPGAKLKQTIRLDQIHETPAPAVETVVDEPVAVTPEPLIAINRPFTAAALQKQWNDFANAKEAQGRQSDFVMLNRALDLQETKEGYVIHLKLDHAVQLQQLNALRPELLAYLRQRLENNAIQIEAEVAIQESTRKIYTSQDKFRHLSEKNPALAELRDVFGLDINF